MTNQPRPEQQIEAYLSSLTAHLVPITLAEREEIRREIGAHIRDAVEESGSPVAAILERLGPPEELAAQYRDGALIRAASASLSPLVLLRATLRLATKGFLGALMLLGGFTGYAIGVSLFLMGVLKPFMPSSVGMWVRTSASDSAGNGAIFGISSAHAQHEILGWWAIPIGLIGGVLVLVVTTLAIRVFLRLSRQWQSGLGGGVEFRATHSALV